MRGPFTYSDLYKSRKSVLVFITNSAYKLWKSCSKWFFIGPRLAYNICRIFEYSWCEHSSKISIPTLIASEIVDLSGYVFWRTSFSLSSLSRIMTNKVPSHWGFWDFEKVPALSDDSSIDVILSARQGHYYTPPLKTGNVGTILNINSNPMIFNEPS